MEILLVIIDAGYQLRSFDPMSLKYIWQILPVKTEIISLSACLAASGTVLYLFYCMI